MPTDAPLPQVLQPIMAATHAQLQRDRAELPLDHWLAQVAARPPVRSLQDALRQPQLALIAEFKPRSPSRGLLRADADPRLFAQAYRPAAAISVLCDAPFFGGGVALLPTFRRLTDQPLLAKGFFVDRYQLAQVRALGADAALLIARLLPGQRLAELLAASRELGLQALVEVHTARELEQALAAGAPIIGVNARDLDSLRIDLPQARALLAQLPAQVVKVAESGIEDQPGIAALRQMHAQRQVDAVLIGTALMTAEDPAKAVSDLGFA